MSVLERLRWLSENPEVGEVIVSADEATRVVRALDACAALWTQGYDNSPELHQAAWTAVDVSLAAVLEA